MKDFRSEYIITTAVISFRSKQPEKILLKEMMQTFNRPDVILQ